MTTETPTVRGLRDGWWADCTYCGEGLDLRETQAWSTDKITNELLPMCLACYSLSRVERLEKQLAWQQDMECADGVE